MKSKFLLVDLNDKKTKKLAETITSSTSRNILSYLAESNSTEGKISKKLDLPISTVHYHMQKLVEAGLVKIKGFTYSEKGREINHYELANQYIIIAPTKTEGIKEKLKNILPIAILMSGASLLIRMVEKKEIVMQKTLVATPETMARAVDMAPKQELSVALWFFLGSSFALLLYILYQSFKEWYNFKQD